MRGPIVYCFEGADNGGSVQNFAVEPATSFTTDFHPNLLGGVTVLTAIATGLYQDKNDPVMRWPKTVTAIPYFANANRGTCAMQVWMAADARLCQPQKQD
jgi:hypothetical protein